MGTPIKPSCPRSPNVNQSSDLAAAGKSRAACPESCKKMLKVDFGDFGPALSPEGVGVSDGGDHHKSGVKVNYPAAFGSSLGGLLCLVLLCLLFRFCVKLGRERLRLHRIMERMQAREVLINEEPVVEPVVDPMDHPIWYIRTPGLQQSVIDAIKVVEYKKDGGLVEGSDCPVCLSEFEEGESLRLLPGCAHAFHVPCIDQWFRSHKNCPMCRAALPDVILNGMPVVSAEAEGEAVRRRQLTNGQSDETETGDENLNPNASEPHSDSDSSVSDNDTNGSTAVSDSSVSDSSKVKEESNLAESHKVNELQPMRRSVSAGTATTTALKINGTVPEVKIQVDSEVMGSQDSDLSPVKKTKATKSGGTSCKGNIPEIEQARASGIAMKRSASYGGKPSSAKSRKHPTLPY